MVLNIWTSGMAHSLKEGCFSFVSMLEFSLFFITGNISVLFV